LRSEDTSLGSRTPFAKTIKLLRLERRKVATKEWDRFEQQVVFETINPERWKNVRVICVEVAEGYAAGEILAYIVKYFLPNTKGESKLRVQKTWKKGEKEFVLAKDAKQFKLELGVTDSQVKTAVRKLVNKRIIDVKLFRWYGNKTRHFLLKKEKFAKAYWIQKKIHLEMVKEDAKRYQLAKETRRIAREKNLQEVFQSV
jgi:hypothetical protein